MDMESQRTNPGGKENILYSYIEVKRHNKKLLYKSLFPLLIETELSFLCKFLENDFHDGNENMFQSYITRRLRLKD